MPVINFTYIKVSMKAFTTFLLLTVSLSTQALTLGAYNIRNFDYDARYKISTNKNELTTMLNDLKIDVLSVEEINNTQAWDQYVQAKLPGYDTEITRCGGAHGQKLGFLYNKNKIDLLSFEEDLSIAEPGNQPSCNSGSRPAAIGLFRVKSTGQKFYGVTLHLKSGSDAGSISKRAKQLDVLKNIITKLKTKSGVKDFYFAGDLNTTEYIKKGSDYHTLTKVTQELGMKVLTSDIKCSAYWWGGSDDGIETPTVLDHLVVTPGLMKVQGVKAKSGGHCQKVSCRESAIKDLGESYASVSDHCPISATIQ